MDMMNYAQKADGEAPMGHWRTTFYPQEGKRPRAFFQNLSFGVTHGTDVATGAEVAQLNEDRYRHTIVLGRTGSGKSNHVQRMEREDIRSGAGVFVLAAHEDDALYALACVPEEREEDVVLLDFANPGWLPRMNPLDIDLDDVVAQDRAIEDVIDLLTADMPYEFCGPRFEKMVRDGLRLLMCSPKEKDRAIANLARVYTDPSYVKDLVAYCDDPHVREQWCRLIPEEKKSNDSGEVAHWFTSKLSRFAADRRLAHVFGAGKSTVDVAGAVKEGKVLIAYVPESVLGHVAARTIASWLIKELRRAIMGRTIGSASWSGLHYGLFEGRDVCESSLAPFFVYVDEFAKYATPDFEVLLAEARKQHVGLVLSTQTLSQTYICNERDGTVGKLTQAIIGNVGTFVCYPMGSSDAERLAKQLDAKADDLMNIKRYQPVVRLMADNQPERARALAVGLRPEPDNPSAPGRIAWRQVESGVWTEVADTDKLVEFMLQTGV